MSGNKTVPNGASVEDFLAAVMPERRAVQARVLEKLFRKVTGFEPVMWGPSIIGYGRYHYIYDSGREGDFLATGFSPRKANLSTYIMPGYQDYSSILARLGKHKAGRSCLWVNKLEDIDLGVLGELIRTGLSDLDRRWKVHPS